MSARGFFETGGRSASHPGVSRFATFAVAAALAAAPGAALADTVKRSSKVSGTPQVRISTISGDVVVTRGKKGEVAAVFDTDQVDRITFAVDDKNKRVSISGPPSLDEVRVAVPAGTEVRVSTTSGKVSVSGVGGDVRGKVTSGLLTIDGAKRVDAAAVSGDVKLTKVTGDVQVKVVSGDVFIDTVARDDFRMSLETVSGDVEWRGRCAKDCRVELQALSADLDLYVEPKSSFNVEFRSRSGDFKNRANANVTRSSRNAVEATYGTGLGLIQAVTFSGDMRLDTQ